MDRFSLKQRSRVMSRIRGRNTAPELSVRSKLHKLGFRFRLHCKHLPGTPDLVFPGRQSVIFIHGCFWHGHTCRRAKLPTSNVSFWTEKIGKNKVRDKNARKLLTNDGWKVLTVWQCELKDSEKLEKKLVSFLDLCDDKVSGRAA